MKENCDEDKIEVLAHDTVQEMGDAKESERFSGSTYAFSIDRDLITTSVFDVDHITMELGQREQLMEDNPVAEQLRIEAIKSIAQKISTKRQIREHLAQTVHRRATTRAKSIGLLRRYRYSGRLYLTRAAKLAQRFVTNFELFYGSMKQIEGHFGSRISAYFKFLRRLLVLNFVLLLFIVSFVTFPQLLAGHDEAKQPQRNGHTQFHLSNLVSGEGYFTNSVMYYGSYSNRSFTLVPGAAEYSLPHAYFLTITVLVLATFVVISVSMGRSYRISFIESSAMVQNILTHKIVCSWDYGIANAKAAQLKHASILHELRAYLDDQQQVPPVANRWVRLRSTALHALAHLTVLAMISITAATLWALLARFDETEHFSSWSALYVVLISNGTVLAFGYACQLLSRLERYRQVATQLNINLLRHFLLQATIVGVLLAFWLTREHPTGCWETAIGQQLYRLLVIDFLISTLLLTSLRAVRYVLHTRYGTIGPFTLLTLPPFCIETHSLRLVYNQTLLWFGVLFAPLLVPVVALKFLIVFYVNKFELIYLCQPPVRLWRSSQMQTLLLVLVFMSLFGVLLTHGYIIMQMPVSTECGPFRGTQYMYQLFMQGILKLREEHLFWRIFVYVTKPAIIGGVLLTMGVAAYYLRAKSRAQIAKVRLLKELLSMEGKDKEFLLANLSKLTRSKDCPDEQLKRIDLMGFEDDEQLRLRKI
uniref:Uncharacterized protein n=1 Tax=Anopheles atroparvus TaxID=41427 RepID=A0A182J950_ANOAO